MQVSAISPLAHKELAESVLVSGGVREAALQARLPPLCHRGGFTSQGLLAAEQMGGGTKVVVIQS